MLFLFLQLGTKYESARSESPRLASTPPLAYIVVKEGSFYECVEAKSSHLLLLLELFFVR